MKADLKDITASRTSVSEGGEEFYNDRVSCCNEEGRGLTPSSCFSFVTFVNLFFGCAHHDKVGG